MKFQILLLSEDLKRIPLLFLFSELNHHIYGAFIV